jgi:hypothetical protein
MGQRFMGLDDKIFGTHSIGLGLDETGSKSKLITYDAQSKKYKGGSTDLQKDRFLADTIYSNNKVKDADLPKIIDRISDIRANDLSRAGSDFKFMSNKDYSMIKGKYDNQELSPSFSSSDRKTSTWFRL